MPKYLLKVSYTLDGIRGVKKEGGSGRLDVATKLCESLGGTLESFYFAFGDTDVYAIVDLPDNTAALAASLAVGTGGGASVTTIPLATVEEVDAATKAQATFRPPGA